MPHIHYVRKTTCRHFFFSFHKMERTTGNIIRRIFGVFAQTARRQIWQAVKPVPPDPILGLVARYKKDPNPNAVNLAQGAYRDGEGKPFVLPSVVKAERRVAQQLNDGSINKEYLGSDGNADFLAASAKFAFGEESNAMR